ncbi:MAG: hypothetical protein H0X33_08445 [Taibaiella sp.]|nr:hypothetical protein [Taibaiella sp.]
MKEYVLLFRGGLDFQNASAEQLQKAMEKWKNWIDELAKAGKFSSGQRLNKNAMVMTGTNRQLSDGPYAEGKEIVGGFVAIKAVDIDNAVEIANGCPIFDHNGIVEVREVAS